MFKKWFGKKEVRDKPDYELMGLRLGGAFKLDDLKLRLIEPKLIVENIARTQFIQAVGVVKLDANSTLFRYYTDDDGFLQVHCSGGVAESHISDVKLWYFFETKGVGSEGDWNRLLSEGISQPTAELEKHSFKRVWETTGSDSPPVAMTEQTHVEGEAVSQTDQFIMLYEREVEDGLFEYLLQAGEEKIIEDRADRCFVVSTGIDVQQADIEIIG